MTDSEPSHVSQYFLHRSMCACFCAKMPGGHSIRPTVTALSPIHMLAARAPIANISGSQCWPASFHTADQLRSVTTLVTVTT